MQLIDQIACVCHEANRAYCETLGDHSQHLWELATRQQQDLSKDSVCAILDNPELTPEGIHETWMAQKLATGWRLGLEKNEKLKTHPCLTPYNDLPTDQKRKDALFGAVVRALM